MCGRKILRSRVSCDDYNEDVLEVAVLMVETNHAILGGFQ